MKKFALIIFVIYLSINTSSAQKILISVDMEGIAGVVTSAQLGPSGFESQRFRQFMTDETNAAIDGAIEAGAKEIVVADSHGNGQNLLIEKLPDNVMITVFSVQDGKKTVLNQRPTINIQQPTSNIRAHNLGVGRWMLDVGCSIHFL